MIHNFEDIKADQQNINKKIRLQNNAKEMYLILSKALDYHFYGKTPSIDFDRVEEIINNIEGIK